MIPKIYKLKLRKAVDFFRSCERYYSRYFLVFFRRNSEENTKVVVVVPKKIVKLRVGRTKMKRQIYNLSLPLLRKTKGLEVVFVVNKKILAVEKQEILDDLEEIFLKIGRLKKNG